MRHLRISVTAVVSVIVALATFGSLSAASHPHHTGRRRSHAVRVIRVGAQRLDHPEGISHEYAQHDPVLAISSAGVAERAQHVAAPPGLDRQVSRVGRVAPAAPMGILDGAITRIVPQPAVSTLSFERARSTRHGTYRLALGRAPPRSL